MSSLSKSIYYNPQHAWGLPDEAYEFTPKEVADNTWNEDDLRNMLQQNQAFGELYRVRSQRRKVDCPEYSYLDPKERPAYYISDKEKLFPWYLFKDL